MGKSKILFNISRIFVLSNISLYYLYIFHNFVYRYVHDDLLNELLRLKKKLFIWLQRVVDKKDKKQKERNKRLYEL